MLTATKSKNGKKLTIEIDLNETGQPSASGKTMVHASTRGNKETDLKINGQNLVLGVNAYTYPNPK
jgi:hypothetical protein